MAEVAERREPDAAVREDAAPRLTRVEDGARGNGNGPVRDGESTITPPAEREQRRDGDHDVPVEPAEAVDEVRQRRAERERADEDRRARRPRPRRNQVAISFSAGG